MIDFFVRRPVTTIMFVTVFVVMGIISFSNLRVEKDPKIDFPIVTVKIECPGATPLEVETLVVNKIEDAVAELSEIKKLRSQSYDNFGYVIIEFILSSDVNVKFIEVKDKVESILNDLPKNINKPIVEKFDPLMSPVMDIVLSGEGLDGRVLYEFADKRLKDRFSSIKGVANVDIYGGKERQINVILDPMLMKQRYISILDVVEAIRDKNRNIPGGLLEKAGTSISIRFLGKFENPKEIEEMILVSRDGANFPLKEIGRVEDSFKKIETSARYQGKEVVGLSLNKISDGNAIDISRELRRRLPEFKSILPKGVSLEIATDTTDFIIDETIQTYISIAIGILLTVIVLYLFTGKLSLTFIASIAIPSSIISTLFLVDKSGFTINFITLLAIATSLGTLIANAIVIVENVLVHLEREDNPVSAAINGTREVSSSIIASTGTNLVVFTPIAFMGGIVGQFMKSFGLTVVYATIFSLLASFTLTPMLCALILTKKEIKIDHKISLANPFVWLVELTNKTMLVLKREYKRIFNLTFRYPKLTITFVSLCFLSVGAILPYIGSDFYPASDEDKITLKIEMPQGSTIDRTSEVTAVVEKRLQEIPEVASLLTSIGKDGVENSAIVVNLISSKERDREDTEIIDELIPFTATIPDAEINIERGEARGGVEGDISINLYGLDYQKMIHYSQSMTEIMEQTGYFRSVKSSYKTPKKEIQFIPNQSLLIENGVKDVTIGDIIRSSIYGDDTNIYKESGEEYKINVELDNRYTQDFEDIKQIDIISKNGLMPVVKLGSLKEEKSLPAIQHRDKQRIIRLEGYLAKSTEGDVMNVLNDAFKELNLEEGYTYKYVGNAEHQKESSGEISKAFLIAVILTYMLLCALMDSLLYPIPILISVGTSFIGVFYALFFLEKSINIASMLGIVMLVGIVVNNSILLLDCTMLKMKEGAPLVEALWLGASEKFTAIIMTSIAIILGVLPQLWSTMPLKTSMGTVIVGGMMASIVFTFIFTPISFWYVEKFRIRFFGQK